MLIKLKKERTHQEDRRLALWLATSAGLLNAIALGAFGFFPSHMTGNTSQLSSEVSSTDLSDILFFGAIILSFVSGAIAARIIVIWGIIHNVRLVFSQVLFVEGLLLAGVSLYEMYFHSFATNQEIIIFLCGLMGIHNSTSTQLSGGRVRSTHITGTQTEIRRLLLQCGIIVKPGTMRSWVSRGDLKPVTPVKDTRKQRYRLSDVYKLAVRNPEKETNIWMLLQEEQA